MQGLDVWDKAGYDMHGLPIEHQVIKKFNLETKNDIEKFGVLNFVNACKKRVEKFSKIQKEQSIKLGQWMAWDESYYTMTDNKSK